ncbi:MAG: hypothetical protein ACI8X5_004073, partial [Planctomycetota bacterium]
SKAALLHDSIWLNKFPSIGEFSERLRPTLVARSLAFD